MFPNVVIPENFLILVVDDVPHNLQVIGSLLDQVGYATTFAASGQQALERLKTTQPDLILLDLMMPDMDGLQVCKMIKANPDSREIPIIFLTASHEQDHLLNAFEWGAVDYITKPFKQLELLARVKTHLMLKHTTDELKKAFAELDRLARIDSLTGILNRRSFFEAATQEFHRACRYQTIFSILLLDVDYFKKINDTYGHLAGDRALVELTSIISGNLRTIDLVGRYGGEEFVILLPHTEAPEAIAVAERIRSLVAETSVPTDAEPLRLTISIGIAVYESDDMNIDRIFDRADRALYQAKARGRNACCLYSLTKLS